MGFFLVMKAELVRSFIITRRYWFRTMVSILIGYFMLMVLIVGFAFSRDAVQETMNSQFADPASATKFVLGFIIGMFAFGVVGMFSQGLQGMARTGILEQLCMSPHGLITNFMAQAVVNAVSNVLSSGFMVWLVTISVGGKLHFDLWPLLAVLALTFINLLGFGFMIGGLVLLFKQIGQVAILLRMGLFGLAIFASEELLNKGIVISSVMHAMPITDAAVCLKYILIQGQHDAEGTFASVFRYSPFYFLILSCFVWTTLGVFCFKILENRSRKKGTLGTY
jgi:ABC-type polysaccharide/polyol phosphate export permease